MAMRRAARMRKEYLYRKSLEGKERDLYEKKEKLKAALAAGKPIPGEIRGDVERLKASIDAEDEGTVKPKVRRRCYPFGWL